MPDALADDTQPVHVMAADEAAGPPCLLSLVVLVGTACLCLVAVGLSTLAGYQDELAVVQTERANTQVAELATQYHLAREDEDAGVLAIAADRYEYIETQQPGYQDAADRLVAVRVVLSYTPTPSPTLTPTPSPTTPASTTPEASPTPTTSPTPEGPQAAQFFTDAQKFYTAGLWEEAIEYLDIVIQLDPAYRRSEVNQMLFEALKQQALIYMRGRNLDDSSRGLPGDQLVRGVQLARRALDLHENNPGVGEVGDLRGEWFFVNGYVTARGYLAGGACGQARPILEELCTLHCGWGYRGVTVQNLLDRANTCTP